MHPQHQLGIRGGVRAAVALSAHAAVHGAGDRAHAVGLAPRPEHDRVQRRHRPRQPAPRILAVPGVVDDARGDERVRSLQEERAGAPEHQDGLAADPPDRALVREVAGHHGQNDRPGAADAEMQVWDRCAAGGP